MKPIHYALKSISKMNVRILLLIILMINTTSLIAGDVSNLQFQSSFEMSNGNYVYDQSSTTYNWNFGLRYRTGKLTLAISAPVVIQNSDLVTQSGGMFLPNQHTDNASTHQNGNHGMGTNNLTTQATKYQFGDVNLYAQYELLEQPGLSLTAGIKMPTSGTGNNIGTGEFDYSMGLSANHPLGNYLLFADASYIILGDYSTVNFNNPIMWGIGAGRFIDNGKYAVSAYYSASSNVFSGFEGYRKISTAVLANFESFGLNFSMDFGFSEITPDFTISAGIETNL